jgi:hypothetical protein
MEISFFFSVSLNPAWMLTSPHGLFTVLAQHGLPDILVSENLSTGDFFRAGVFSPMTKFKPGGPETTFLLTATLLHV